MCAQRVSGSGCMSLVLHLGRPGQNIFWCRQLRVDVAELSVGRTPRSSILPPRYHRAPVRTGAAIEAERMVNAVGVAGLAGAR